MTQRWRRRTRAVAVTVLLAAAPVTGAAFELLRANGNPCSNAQNLFWTPARAVISVDPLTSQTNRDLVLQALDTWNRSAARFRFNSGSGSRCNRDDGVIGLGFATTNCDGRSLDGVLALTTSIFRTDSGQLVDGNVTFNSDAAATLASQPIFLQAALHELGHVLGLDHSDACGGPGAGTLMKATLILGEPRLTAPQADDIAGANRIYGGGPDPTPLPEGSNSCAIRPGTASHAWTVLLLATAVLIKRARLHTGSHRIR